jgi:hypothetical protein
MINSFGVACNRISPFTKHTLTRRLGASFPLHLRTLLSWPGPTKPPASLPEVSIVVFRVFFWVSYRVFAFGQSTSQATRRQVVNRTENCCELYSSPSCCSLLTGLDADSYPLVGDNGWCEEASSIFNRRPRWHCRTLLRSISFRCSRIPILLLFMPNV